MRREPWYFEEVRQKTSFKWTPEMRVAIYTMRVNDGLPISEIQDKVYQRIGRYPNKNRINNLVRMMRKNMARRCYRCGKFLPWNKSSKGHLIMCQLCKKEKSDYKKALRSKRLEVGLCGVCGRHPVENSFATCQKCLSETYRRRLKEGLCGHCGKRPIVEGSIALCFICLCLDGIKSYNNRKKREHA